MRQVISFLKVVEHQRLSERIRALRPLAQTAFARAPDQLTSPVLADAAARLLRDIYRLVLREPGARALPRIDPGQPPSHRLLADQLADAQLALDLYQDAHRDHDEETNDDWLTFEGLADIRHVRLIPAR